jgi:hypothetical protein
MIRSLQRALFACSKWFIHYAIVWSTLTDATDEAKSTGVQDSHIGFTWTKTTEMSCVLYSATDLNKLGPLIVLFPTPCTLYSSTTSPGSLMRVPGGTAQENRIAKGTPQLRRLAPSLALMSYQVTSI